jgi:outer membrane protein assembly factor BamD (BamD/ComL family)
VRGAGLLLLALATFSSGCAWDDWHVFKSSPPPPPPADSVVLRDDKLEAANKTAPQGAAKDLAGGHELYRRGEYAKAEKVFHKIADNTKNSPQIAEEARYYEAECLRREGHYPKAGDTYNKLLIDFPAGMFREQAVQHMFEIANYWLDDTRKEMEEDKDKHDGKHVVVWPEFMHWDKTKPLLDEEGRAMEKLEQVRYNDITGPLADKALFLAGSVKFFRKDYKEANHYFSQLAEMHPNSPFVEQAIKLAIISKELSTGGPDYDSRQLAEARKLVDTALRAYPNLAAKESDFLNRQLISIQLQVAEKDFRAAEFYERTGHPCSAYFQYQVVRLRYPGTKYFDQATERMNLLKAKLEKKGGTEALDVPPPGQRGLGAAPTPSLGPGQLEITPAPRQLPPDMVK